MSYHTCWPQLVPCEFALSSKTCWETLTASALWKWTLVNNGHLWSRKPASVLKVNTDVFLKLATSFNTQATMQCGMQFIVPMYNHEPVFNIRQPQSEGASCTYAKRNSSVLVRFYYCAVEGCNQGSWRSRVQMPPAEHPWRFHHQLKIKHRVYSDHWNLYSERGVPHLKLIRVTE